MLGYYLAKIQFERELEDLTDPEEIAKIKSYIMSLDIYIRYAEGRNRDED